MTSAFTTDDFLADTDAQEIDWVRPSGTPSSLNPVRVDIAFGSDALEIAFATSETTPRMDDVRRLWNLRWGRRAAPVLLVVGYQRNAGWEATVCGPGENPAAISGLDLRQVDRICAAALAEPNPSAAKRTLQRLLTGPKDQLIAGLTNQGLFASHELRHGVPARADWDTARATGEPLLSRAGEDLIAGLGYKSTAHGSIAQVLSTNGTRHAVAVLLNEAELFDRPGQRFGAVSPVTQGLSIAQEQNLPWLIVIRGTQLRLYPAKPDVGVGRKGQSETFVELDLALLTDDDAGYLPLLFGPTALDEHGTVAEILAASVDHASALGARLRDRVYVDVVPALAVAVANAMKADKGSSLDEADLHEAYHRTLLILFRLLFVAYAEDRGLLPYQRNPRYTRKALKTLAREFADDPAHEFDAASHDRWDDLRSVWRAVDDGNREWDVPAYNGGLFAADPELHPSGHAISRMRLTNAEIGPALKALLIDASTEGDLGPVDFRSLSVREFGTIYEGLLESSLSIAPSNLTVDPRTKAYLPAKDADLVVVPVGEVYFHNASGARKATGSYFTKAFAVEHLLDTALEPAITDHLAQMKDLLDIGDEAGAAEKFFDFRIADLAMGSGHFLVAAIDRVENRFAKFLTDNPIPAVNDELSRLSHAAEDALGDAADAVEIETSMLLRRQIARRCIYGLDLNLMAVELARLAIWIHTFVPGLPMSSLDHGLRVGNSLTGIATVEEVLDVLEPGRDPNQESLAFGAPIVEALEAARARLLRVARTAEATKAEARESAREHAKAMSDAKEARALFDAAIALQVGVLDRFPLNAEEAVASGQREDVIQRARDLQSAHLPYFYPEVFLRERPGFDVILGNPPWDKVRHEAQQFWVVRDPGLNALPASKRDAHIDLLRRQRPHDAAEEAAERSLRETLQTIARNGYTLLGSGHFDFAKLFAERFLSAVREDGSLGVVMPQGLLLLGGWSKLRTALLDRGDVQVVETRNTNGWMFDDVHKSYAIVLVSVRPAADPHEHEVVILPGVNSLAQFHAVRSGGQMQMRVADLDELSEGRVVPWFNGGDDATVFDSMRTRPTLASGDGWVAGKSDSSRWDFSGSGKHKAYVSTVKENPQAWGALMTRHVDQYAIADDPIQRWINDPRDLALTQPKRALEVVEDHVRLSEDHPVIVYRFPSRNDDSRTIIATAMPSEGYLYSTGYAHGVAHPTGTPTRTKLALLGYLNSIVADWWARRFVDRHVGSRIINGLPLPDWTPEQINTAATLVTELLHRNGIRAVAGGYKIPTGTDLGDLSDRDLRVQLDGLALAGFNLDAHAAEIIFTDFKDKQESVPSHYRRLVMQQIGR